jgi:hypothetical protein
VVFTGIENVPITFETLLFVHVFYYTAIRYILSSFAPYIPTPEGGGFTAFFDKLQGR